MKNRWLWLFSVALFLPIALLWGELFVHILLPQDVDAVLNIVQPDPIVGYIYKPNAKASESGREYEVSYSTNSLGLRDREYDLNETGVFRVLLFGDSFSESHGLSLEKSLPKQIELHLQKELDRRNIQIKAEVINASFGGYSPYHYWKSYGRWKSTFKPNLVLIGFYMGNDFQCEDQNIRYEIADGEIVGWSSGDSAPVTRRENPIRNLRKWLASHSELYVLMRNFFYYNDILGFLTSKAKAQESAGQLKPYLVPEQKEIRPEREKCFGYLKRLKEEAASDGVPVALITIPVKLEIDRKYLEGIVKTQGIDTKNVDLEQPYKALSEFCGSVNIALMNPSDALKTHNVNETCYFRYDGHWNAKGIEVAAISVVRQWKGQKLVPLNQP